jgi:hypothetical protein
MATSNFTATIDSSNVSLIYAAEGDWGVAETGTGTRVRLTGESLSETKTRNRPSEIVQDGYASHALTTQVQAGGDTNFALSFDTYSAFMAAAMNGTWSGSVDHDGSSDVSAAATVNTFTAPANTFDNVRLGQYIKTSGFTDPANNGYHLVTATSGGTEVTVASTLVTESNVSANIRGDNVMNGVDTTTYTIEKQLSSALNLIYAGAYCTGMSLNASVGDYVQGAFSWLCKSEAKGADGTNFTTYNAAPTGTVIDTVGGFSALDIDGTSQVGVVQSMDFSLTKNNARGQYAVGSSSAVGMGRGTVQVDGNMSMYFDDFTEYDYYKDETDIVVALTLADPTGNEYRITFPVVSLMNPAIQAGGPDTDVLANFQMECSQGTYSTIQIDRFGVTAV